MKLLKYSLFFIALASSPVHANLITFDEVGIVHGSVISGQYDGVTISADNYYFPGDDYAVAYDSSPATSGEDRDLEGPWDVGNIDLTTDLGNVLIIQENRDWDGTGTEGCSAIEGGICDAPDDEGRRPAGELKFDFDMNITSFGFDLIDIEPEEAPDGWVVWFFDMSTFLGGINFTDFVASEGAVFGNNTINRIDPIDLSYLGTDVNSVVIRLGGSGAVDNINYSVPEPLTIALFGMGLLGLGFARRKA